VRIYGQRKVETRSHRRGDRRLDRDHWHRLSIAVTSAGGGQPLGEDGVLRAACPVEPPGGTSVSLIFAEGVELPGTLRCVTISAATRWLASRLALVLVGAIVALAILGAGVLLLLHLFFSKPSEHHNPSFRYGEKVLDSIYGSMRGR
jgi:hypothetical protein